MTTYKIEDHRKYAAAMLSRDLRRLVAIVYGADIDDETIETFDSAIELLNNRVWLFSFYDPTTGQFIHDLNRYSDGRPVTTSVEQDYGTATVLHLPDPSEEAECPVEELSAEAWPVDPREPPCPGRLRSCSDYGPA
jgi:hypothetical protein